MIRFGLRVPQERGDGARLRELAVRAEEMGFASLWVYDHLFHCPPRPPELLEAWTLLSFLASATRRIRLGTLVLCGGFRSPALLAKMVATLDVLSGGRLDIGYGIGNSDREHLAYGYPFPSARERLERLREGIEVMKLLWTGEPVTYAGRYHRLGSAICRPVPLQRPHPPLVLGGVGERRLLALVAREADGWNCLPLPLASYRHKTEALDAHCRAAGRDPDSVARTLLVPTFIAESEREVRDQIEAARREGHNWIDRGELVQGTPETCLARYRDYARLGVSLFIVWLPDPANERRLRLLRDELIAPLSAEAPTPLPPAA